MPERRRGNRIYVIGDSNSLAMRDMLFRRSKDDEWTAFNTTYVPGLTVTDLLRDGKLDESVEKVFSTFGLVEDGEPIHLSRRRDVQSNAYASGQPLLSPIVLLIAGDIDLRSFVYRMLLDGDIVLPDDAPYQLVDAQCAIIPLDIIEARLEEIAETAVAAANRWMKLYGFRVFLHAVNPPTLDEDAFALTNEYSLPAVKRYKIAWLYNRTLARLCDERQIGFVDIWPDCCGSDGFLQPAFELDGTHLAPEATEFTASKLLTGITISARNKTNSIRYEMMTARAANRRAARAHIAPAILDLGTSLFTPDRPAAPSQTATSQTTFDWVSAFEFPPNSARYDLTSDDVAALTEALHEGPASEIIASHFGSDFTCVAARYVELGRADGSRLRCKILPPANLLKAILPLTASSITVSESANRARFEVGAGRLFVYEPHADTEIGFDERITFYELTLLPRLAGQKQRTISQPLADWPADPFCYKVPQGVSSSDLQEWLIAPTVVYGTTIGGEATSDYRSEVAPPSNDTNIEQPVVSEERRPFWKKLFRE